VSSFHNNQVKRAWQVREFSSMFRRTRCSQGNAFFLTEIRHQLHEKFALTAAISCAWISKPRDPNCH
jgi:hypothetical protein